MRQTVLVSGDFGIIHQGHIDHIMKAYYLGDWLYIVTHRDESIKERKGYEPIPLWARMILLKALLSLLGGQGEVILAKDTDGKTAKTLEWYRPKFFAKGGDRIEGNIPPEELEVCERLGIEIVYGVGKKLGSSSVFSQKVESL